MALYNIFNGYEVDEGVYPSEYVTSEAPPAHGYAFIKGIWMVSDGCVTERLEKVKIEVYQRINNKVIEMYNTFTPLFMEYTQRETQAMAWRDSDYYGTPPAQVLAFSVPAKMNPVEACNLIIYQAKQFRDVLDFMASLRMKKIEVEGVSNIAQALEIEKKTLANMRMVLANLP